MIPTNVAGRTQLTTDTAASRPVAATQEVTDKLSDLVPGQRVMADIQALMPNGTYRAVIGQRDVTLALPFAAKSGDSLELEVVETDGKLTLAVASRPSAEKTTGEAVSTTLSRTGQLITDLLGDKAGAKPLPLNGNQPISPAPPTSAGELAPLLRQAISQSGMFYESHQAQWVAGNFPMQALLEEHQGKLSAALQKPQAGDTAATASSAPPPQRLGATEAAGTHATALQPGAPAIAPEALPLVQHQLEALASQNYVWQGQICPGQEMRWEIVEEDGGRREAESGATASAWQTRLRLTLPRLGEINAQLRLQQNQIGLSITAPGDEARTLMRDSAEQLRRQLEAAGLALSGFGIGDHEAA